MTKYHTIWYYMILYVYIHLYPRIQRCWICCEWMHQYVMEQVFMSPLLKVSDQVERPAVYNIHHYSHLFTYEFFYGLLCWISVFQTTILPILRTAVQTGAPGFWHWHCIQRSCELRTCWGRVVGCPRTGGPDLFSHLSGPKSFRLLSARTALPRTSKNLKRSCPGTREPYSWRRYQKASYDFLWPILAHTQIISNLETIWNPSSSVPMLRRVLHAGSVVLDLRLPATVVAEPP